MRKLIRRLLGLNTVYVVTVNNEYGVVRYQMVFSSLAEASMEHSRQLSVHGGRLVCLTSRTVE